MELRSGYVASSAASTPPQGEESQAQTGPATSLGPSTLPSQISASEALRIIDSDNDDDTELLAIADTLFKGSAHLTTTATSGTTATGPLSSLSRDLRISQYNRSKAVCLCVNQGGRNHAPYM